MTTVLVTGGAGFIGSHLVDRLLARGHSVVVVDDFSSGSREYLPDGEPRLRVLDASVVGGPAWEEAASGATCIFHLAALISGPESLAEPRRYFDTNVGGLQRVIELARRLDSPRLVFASTSGIYGNAPRRLRSEDDAPTPTTVYALSKLAGEHLLEMYRGTHHYDDVSFRFFNVYGPRQNRNHPYANVTCKFSYAAATSTPVALYGDGTQTRDFVFVDDIVRVLVEAMDKPLRRRVYNVGTGREHSVGALLELVQQLSGTRLQVEQRGDWPNDIRAIVADVKRLEEDFGWTPSISLEDGLRRTIEYFRQAQSR